MKTHRDPFCFFHPPMPILLLLAVSIPHPAQAADPDTLAWLEKAKTTVRSAAQALTTDAGQQLNATQLNAIADELLDIRTQAQTCIQSKQVAAQQRQKDIDMLGPKSGNESKSVTQARFSLIREHDALVSELADCQFLLIHLKDAMDKVAAAEKASLTRQLLLKGPDLGRLLQDSFNASPIDWTQALDFLENRSGIGSLSAVDLAALVLVAVLGFFGGRRLHRIRLAIKPKPCVDQCTHFALALTSGIAHWLPVVGTLGGPLLYLCIKLPLAPLPFITEVTALLLGCVLILGLIDAVLQPAPPADYYLSLDETTGRLLAGHLKLLALLMLAGFVLFQTELAKELSRDHYLLTRAVYAIFLFINLSWLLWNFTRIFSLPATVLIRLSTLAVLILGLGAEFLGYRHLSLFAVTGLLGSLAGFFAFWFVNLLAVDLFDGLDFGYQPWQQRLRGHLGLDDQTSLPGLIWIRIIAGLTIWGGFGLWVLWVWGLSQEGMDLVFTLLQQGFDIGSFHVVPVRIVTALLVFSLLYTVSDWFKQKVVSHWLNKARIERGARDALITVTGYFGLAVSLLIALSVAGVEFANIAIIAGALSVGIGFGLQNIVNNFVSGLILLIERPIRTGDWIMVGATEGFVGKISIRSTQIKTFDGSDIIVPNSEFISGQVTNWMLHDSFGRVKVPVGVAYGTDLDKVRDILLNIARQHEMVVTGNRLVADPAVLMMGFGDSSLNLELRCFIHSIDKKAKVFSDLCFTINSVFKREQIEIPFPQRDVHFKQ